MSPNLVVISLIQMKQMAKMPFAKDDHMVKTVAPDRADQPLHVSVLPWRARRDRSVSNAHTPTRRMKASPYAQSRSRIRYRGGAIQPSASVNCCATHWALGWAVTPATAAP